MSGTDDQPAWRELVVAGLALSSFHADDAGAKPALDAVVTQPDDAVVELERRVGRVLREVGPGGDARWTAAGVQLFERLERVAELVRAAERRAAETVPPPRRWRGHS